MGFIDKGVHFMGHIMPMFRPEDTAVMQDILLLDGGIQFHPKRAKVCRK
jgi:hypothetical protein